jgi:ribosomal protein L11 methyltransferase
MVETWNTGDGSGEAGSDRPGGRAAWWLLLSALAPPRGEEVLLVEVLRRLGAHAVERHGERYVALLPPPRDLQARLREAEAAIRAGTSLREPALAWRWQSRTEWAERWSRELPPRRVGRRWVVHPTGSRPPLREGDLPIRLVPGPGFGTAEHPTTRGCLRLLEDIGAAGARAADVGSGSGILAVAAALLGAREVLAFEVDPHACAAARDNVVENGVEQRVTARRIEVRPDTLSAAGRFDLVMANLQAAILLPLLPGLARALAPAGAVVVSGILRGEVPRALRAVDHAGLRLAADDMDDGWWSARLDRAP